MEQKAPQFGRKVDSKAISEILSIDESDVDDRFPVWEVSTGLPSIIVPLRTMDAVKRCRVNLERFMEFVREAFSANILVFSKETLFEENDLHARVFADDAGIPEDAATGSANGNLAGYLLETGYFGNDQLNYRVEQGYEMGRPSLLKVKAGKANGKYDIRVGGRVITVAKGDWIVE